MLWRIIMFKSIMSKSLFSLSLAVAIFAAGQSQAADQGPKIRKHMRQGDVTHQTKRTPTENGFIRNTTLTNAEGKTASRNATVVIDKEAGTRTRTMTGTNFKGEVISGQSLAHKTENGFTNEGQFTGADGKVTTRSVNAVVDKTAGTVTKNISVTPEGGETITKTVVTDLHKRDE
jgi:hypothetical protein